MRHRSMGRKERIHQFPCVVGSHPNTGFNERRLALRAGGLAKSGAAQPGCGQGILAQARVVKLETV